MIRSIICRGQQQFQSSSVVWANFEQTCQHAHIEVGPYIEHLYSHLHTPGCQESLRKWSKKIFVNMNKSYQYQWKTPKFWECLFTSSIMNPTVNWRTKHLIHSSLIYKSYLQRMYAKNTWPSYLLAIRSNSWIANWESKSHGA